MDAQQSSHKLRLTTQLRLSCSLAPFLIRHLRLPGTPRAHSKKYGLQSLTLRKGQERQVPCCTGLKPASAGCLRQLYSPENVELTKRKRCKNCALLACTENSVCLLLPCSSLLLCCCCHARCCSTCFHPNWMSKCANAR